MNTGNLLILELDVVPFFFPFYNLSLIVLSFPSFTTSSWHLSIYKSELTMSLIVKVWTLITSFLV